MFKLDTLEPDCEDYGQAVIYHGTLPDHPYFFRLDNHHKIMTGKVINYVISCHVISCHLMSCHVISCQVISCHLMSCHLMSSHVMSSHVMSSHVISCHLMSSHLMSCHLMSSHLISCHLISSHSFKIDNQIVSYFIMYNSLCSSIYLYFQVFPVCGNTYRMLNETRFKNHFTFIGDFSRHFGLFQGCGKTAPFLDSYALAALAMRDHCC